MASRGCRHHPDSFCYICGEHIKKRGKKFFMKTSVKVCEAYQKYFGMPVGDQDKPWAPHYCCEHCKKTLEGWLRGEKRSLKFSNPRVWLEPTDHSTNCFFCMVDVSKRRKGKNAAAVIYPDIPSSMAPIPHCSKYPVPVPPGPDEVQDNSSDEMEHMDADDLDFQPKAPEKTPHFPNQKEINDLIRDMGLTKSNAELFISRMKEWNLVKEEVHVTTQRSRHEPFSGFYTFRDGLCFCHDVPGLFDAIGMPFVPKEWRLFIDSSTKSLKAVLLHNGNKLPTLPLAHSVSLKEDYYSVKVLLEALKYNEYKWEIIGDFKMVAFLLGLQGGFIKFQCFLCLWDSRATSDHYRRKNWDPRTEFVVGTRNVMWEPLVDPNSVLMPPLHIKLGLMKQFVRALDKECTAFKYLVQFFPKLSEAKIKGGIFVGPQIKKIFASAEFSDKLSKIERTAWNCFKVVVDGFLGNNRAENYQELVQDLIKAYSAMGCRMSLKLHMLEAHLEKFKDNMGAYSEEQGEQFHQDVKEIERRYQGRYDERMMGDYIWGLVRECDLEYNRKSRKSSHF